jgi:peroxiredoxin
MNMSSQSTESQPSQGAGLAITSLVLGIISVPFSIFVIGAATGLFGILFGAIHLAKRAAYRQMAIWGIGLSLIGIIFSVRLGLSYRKAYRTAVERWQNQATKWEDWQGVRAPDLAVTTLDGKAVRLSDLRGKRVILDFWATWCPPCVKEIPHFIELAKDPAAQDVVIIGISSEDEAKLRSFVSERGINYAIASARDESLPEPYRNVRAIPTTFFMDRNGVIQKIFEGYHDYDTLRAAALAADFAGEVREQALPASTTNSPSAD